MNFEEYQKKARETAIYPKEYSIIYPTLGLAGESGEVAENVKKHMRDGSTILDLRDKLIFELGDVLWYIANIAADLHIPMQKIAEANIKKLNSRMKRGKLQGSGDDR